ncbi:hypothetical protein [Nocardioides sp. CFH 31398]|uniref:hypothetical protein n=1 Tax=Nocardioides sp. CFH 31398 TaxID=2919579 RepID=UPI001F05A462|nr:hypothetical protein [Nocardioides sp. CFH 31398]MCH1867459.1 hypothetical protein [Nocardioides sp. CFH 31398]
MGSRARGSVVVAVLGLAAGGCAVLGLGGPSYGDDLSVDDDGTGGHERVTLSDGSELAVGYVGDGEYAAQWSDPEGEGWTSPQTVVDGGDLVAAGVQLDADGMTAVASFDWYGADDDERETYARVDAAVCRDVSCEPIEGAGGPELAQDGTFATVTIPNDDVRSTDPAPPYRIATWTAEGGRWEQTTVEGPPLDMQSFLRPGLVLLEDGRLATVRTDESDGCRYVLWAGEPRSSELTEVYRTPSLGGSYCVLDDVRSTGTAVTFSTSTTGDTAAIRPSGDSWTDDLPESGLLAVEDRGRRAGIAMQPVRLEDGSTTAIGSPDGRRIVAQYRPRGEREWTRPATVARAAPGQRCRGAEAEYLTDSTDVVFLVACWPEDAASGDQYGGPTPVSGLALGSADGRRWVARPLDRPAFVPQVQLQPSLLVSRGAEESLLWREGARAFDVVRLPLPNPTVDGLVVTGGEAFRATGNPDRRRPCRPRWDVAPVDATAWSYGGPILPIPGYARRPADCYGDVMDEAGYGYTDVPAGRKIEVGAVIESLSGSVEGTLVRRGGRWQLR